MVLQQYTNVTGLDKFPRPHGMSGQRAFPPVSLARSLYGFFAGALPA